MAKQNEPNARARRAAERAASGATVAEPKASFLDVSQVRAELEQAAAEFGCVVESVTAKGSGANRTLEVVVDYAEGTEQLSLDTIAEISQAMSARLDATDDGEAPYMLEVSSPGATRPLRETRHWERSVGRLIAVTPAEGDGYLARLIEVGQVGPVLARKKNTKKGQKESYNPEETVRWEAISSAHVEIEFNH
ncbi:ribosome assembly cofactor RimP [Rothia sp. LK2588]|uniref:ribosome maturation factor RimP n=1 Tax=Rothia sp. LK2588 TaxID=3114369 RepID=UPI0034CF2E4E